MSDVRPDEAERDLPAIAARRADLRQQYLRPAGERACVDRRAVCTTPR